MSKNHMMDPQRRRLLGHALASATLAATGGLSLTRVAFAAPCATDARFVLVILRGALDGLAAVPPVGDPDYARLRGALAMDAPGRGAGALPLDGTFALHPSLAFLHECWKEKSLCAVHAVATPYRERSHFDAQDVLESGMTRPHATTSGWLNRALAVMPPGCATGNKGIALGANIPLVMRGPVEVASWSPSRLPQLDADTLQRLADLYAGDPILSVRLADARAAGEMSEGGMAEEGTAPGKGNGGRSGVDMETASSAARFLAQPEGPRIAVFDTTGWDTHANQGAGEGLLALRLATLDRSLQALRENLGETWRHTVVLVATEFGRTVAVNGTRGTDHGTGAAALLLGGAVAGGRVAGTWPGLSAGALYQGRDLAATTDLRAVIKGLLGEHLGISPEHLENQVFPDSRNSGVLKGLIRS
ncbi:MAG: hypothetical protein RL030_1201 [Pseudomonadota bacterium]